MKRRYHPLYELVLTRIREFVREPEAIFWVYVFPIFLMVGLGLAFRDPGEPVVRVGIAGSDRAGSLLRALEEDPAFEVERVSDPEAGLQNLRNPYDVVVVFESSGIRYLYDRARPESRYAHLRVDRALQAAAGRRDALPARSDPITVPGSRYIDWLIPGLMGINIMGGGLWGVGFVTVELRMRKLLKRLYATPMRRSDFLGALLLSRLVFLIPEMAVILAVGMLFFDLEVRGSPLALAAVILAGAASFAGLGLLAACRARKIETISGILNAVMVPMWICSGVFFSSERFPAAMQPFVQALPLTQLNNALRAVILEGGGLGEVIHPIGALVLWGAVAFPLAVRWFRWQ